MRAWFSAACVAAVCIWVAAAGESVSIRGKLVQSEAKPRLETAGKIVYLDAADEPVAGVLNDPRLAGSDFEAVGHFTASGRFLVDPVHTRPVFVHKGGKRLYVTYWCEVCAIRTYAPGKCWCCQKDTDLDLRETEQ
jgi:hypothetical protein